MTANRRANVGDAPNDDISAVEQYAEQVHAFQVHAGVVAVTTILVFIVNLAINVSADLTGQWSAWWAVWALIGSSVGVAVHGLVVRVNRPSEANTVEINGRSQ